MREVMLTGLNEDLNVPVISCKVLKTHNGSIVIGAVVTIYPKFIFLYIMIYT